MRIGIFLFTFLLAFFAGCSKKNKDVSLSNEQKMEILLAHQTVHLQSDTEKQLLKENHIKSASYVTVNFQKGKIDSTTYKEYDKEGRLIIWTTSECHTMGCTPFITRHDIYYAGDKMTRMGDYTFNKKFNSIRDCWAADTSNLSLFGWENYSYRGDTIFVEDSRISYTYVKDSKERLIFRGSAIKTSPQKSEIIYKHQGNKTITTLAVYTLEAEAFEEYNIKDEKTVLLDYKGDSEEKKKVEYKFNSLGLLSEVINYREANITSKTKINYSYF